MDRDKRPDREAADWCARLNRRQVATDELEAFYAWRRDPANAKAYERAERVWHLAGGLANDPDIVDASARALARSGWLRRHWRSGAIVACAAFLMLAVGVGLLARPQRLDTAVGEQRLVRLDDGTRLRLDTASHLQVRLGRTARSVTLDAGRAFFEVAHDATRPFTVDADGATVTAIGTRFSVRRDGDQVSVVLSEGSVRITTPGGGETLLSPGEQVRISAGRLQPTQPADLALLESWTTGRLVFRDMPLREAVAEVSRYTATPIVLAPDVDASGRVSGVFDTGDSEAFLAAVTAVFDLDAHREPDRILLSN